MPGMPTVRSIFISDIHLGTRACHAERLVDFLRAHHTDNIYLIGDIVDFWAMRRSITRTEAQNTVVQKLLRRARRGEHIVLIPGNHDEALRDYVGTSFGGIKVASDYVHELADGRRFLLLHGDEFDQITRHHRWIAVLGDVMYDVLVRLNAIISLVRRRFGLTCYWSLAGYAKRRVKQAMQFVFDFEDCAIRAARQRNLDGVICGHIHHASMRDMNGIAYVNSGDWVESCTAIAEHHDGSLEIIRWTRLEHERRQPLMLPRAEAAE